jgi:carbonic anhydrase/acetyltransferase-like protein (isoleucine patch superfamily)
MRHIGQAYIADTARVMGDVVLEAGVSVWYGVVIRGDVAKITVGEGSNVQDNAVIHCDFGYPQVIGKDVSIGHGAVCHGEAIGDGTLIGMGAKLLGHCKIGAGCIVAAGAVVPPGLVVPDGMLIMGVPGKVLRPVNEEEKKYLQVIPARYRELSVVHATKHMDARVKPYGG